MPTFVYEAVDNKGKKIKAEIEAANKQEAVSQIHSMGYFPSNVREKAAEKAVTTGGPTLRKGGFGRVSQKQLTQFTTQLSILQDAGLPIVRSLKILEGQLKPGPLKNTLAMVAEDVETGSTFSEALAKHPKVFDRLYVNMIKAGEAGGVLDTILRRLAEFMEKAQRLKKKIVGAAVYPICVLSVAGLILVGIMMFVVPSFQKIFSDLNVELPALTEMLIGMSDALRDWWFLVPGIPLSIWAAYRVFTHNKGGRMLMDKFWLHVPIFGQIIKKSTISRFTRTLGTLITSGVPILEALAIVKGAIGNLIIQNAINDVHNSIREGESIAEPLANCGEFDDIVVNMIDVGEETGELDKMLIKIADNYDEEVDILVASMVSLMEPILIIFMGLTIGFIVVALFLPLISLIEQLG